MAKAKCSGCDQKFDAGPYGLLPACRACRDTLPRELQSAINVTNLDSPGGKKLREQVAEYFRSAQIRGSAVVEGSYRYLLRREITNQRGTTVRGLLVWVMFNPSLADEHQDDPTLRRCIAFTRAWGYSALEVVNLYAFRTPYPQELPTSETEAIGIHTDQYIQNSCDRAETIIAAWGAQRRAAIKDRIARVLALTDGKLVMAIGKTANGMPMHPLYAHGDSKPFPWDVAGIMS